MQDYKISQGSWPSNPITIGLFIVAFEIAAYYLLAPLIDLVKTAG